MSIRTGNGGGWKPGRPGKNHKESLNRFKNEIYKNNSSRKVDQSGQLEYKNGGVKTSFHGSDKKKWTLNGMDDKETRNRQGIENLKTFLSKNAGTILEIKSLQDVLLWSLTGTQSGDPVSLANKLGMNRGGG